MPLVRVETSWNTNPRIGTRHTVEIPIDGVPMAFRWSGPGDSWLAYAELDDGVALVVTALAWPVEETRLVSVRVESLDPA